MKVQNMTGRTGREVTNQFIIEDQAHNITWFQSYNSMICRKAGRKITLDRSKWDYSVTTGRYRNKFLGESKQETQAKIDSGEYTLADLN